MPIPSNSNPNIKELITAKDEPANTSPYMKIFLAFSISTLVLALMWQTWNNTRGDTRLLEAIHEIRVGQTKEQVRAYLGKNVSVVPANSLPPWLRDEVPERECGEYWYHFMGYPPRNIIIYFDSEGRVDFVTWAPT